MRNFLIVVLIASGSLVSAQDLIRFENGQTADASDINSNFESLESRINELPDSTCTISNSSGTTSVNCPDGTSASLVNQGAQTCSEKDFLGVWLYDEVDPSDGYRINAFDYVAEAGGTIARYEYVWTPTNGFEFLGEYLGTWEFESLTCSARIAASITGPDSLEGVVWISPGKSVARGFFCDEIGGCAVGVLTKYVEYGEAKGEPPRGLTRGVPKR